MNKKEMVDKLTIAITRANELISNFRDSDHPQVKLVKAEVIGRRDAFKAVLAELNGKHALFNMYIY